MQGSNPACRTSHGLLRNFLRRSSRPSLPSQHCLRSPVAYMVCDRRKTGRAVAAQGRHRRTVARWQRRRLRWRKATIRSSRAAASRQPAHGRRVVADNLPCGQRPARRHAHFCCAPRRAAAWFCSPTAQHRCTSAARRRRSAAARRHCSAAARIRQPAGQRPSRASIHLARPRLRARAGGTVCLSKRLCVSALGRRRDPAAAVVGAGIFLSRLGRARSRPATAVFRVGTISDLICCWSMSPPARSPIRSTTYSNRVWGKSANRFTLNRLAF